MVRDFLDSFRFTLTERFVSPLSGGFTLAWLLYNHEVILYFFSDYSAQKKVRLIHEYLYPDAITLFINGFLIPLCIAMFFTLIYPIPARWVELKVLDHKRRTAEARSKALKERI